MEKKRSRYEGREVSGGRGTRRSGRHLSEGLAKKRGNKKATTCWQEVGIVMLWDDAPFKADRDSAAKAADTLSQATRNAPEGDQYYILLYTNHTSSSDR